MRARGKEREADIRGWFKDHRATFGNQGELQTLDWRKPDSWHCAIRYVIQGPVLFVWGDLEAAVYRWSSNISFDFLAGCDLQYFEGKCEASPKGRDYRDFDPYDGLADLDEQLKYREEEGSDAPPPPHLVDEARHAIQCGREDWHAWLRDNGYDMFGDCWYEYAPSIGMSIARTCEAHLIGIKMAFAQASSAKAAAA